MRLFSYATFPVFTFSTKVRDDSCSGVPRRDLQTIEPRK